VSLLTCAKSKLKPAQYKELEEVHGALLERYNNNAALADQGLLEYFTTVTDARKRRDFISVRRTAEAEENIAAILNDMRETRANWSAGARALDQTLYGKVDEVRAGTMYLQRVDYHAKQKVQMYLNELHDMYVELAPKGIQLKGNTEGVKQLVRGIINPNGKNIDPKYLPMAKRLNKLWHAQLGEFRANGGLINRLEGYMPVSFNRAAAKNVGEAEWVRAYTNMNDWRQIPDFRTGKMFTNEAAFIEQVAIPAYNNIVNKRDSLTRKVRGGDFSTRNQNRITKPRNAEAYLEFNAKYGVGDDGLFDLITHHTSQMAHDIGVMELMGPVPRSLVARAGKADRNITPKEVQRLNSWYRTLVGEWAADESDSLLASAVMSVNNLLDASLLGSAPVAAIGDHIFTSNARRLFDMVGGPQLTAYFQGLVGKPDEIVSAIHIAEAMSHQSVARFSAEADSGLNGSKILHASGALRNMSFRVSGLQNITLATGDQMSLAWAGNLGYLARSKTAWDGLNGELRSVMIQHGVTPADWARLVEAGPNEFGVISGRMLPDELQDIGAKLRSMELYARTVATNAPDLRVRNLATGNFAGPRVRGDAMNLVMQSVMKFKSFPMQVLYNHFFPAMIKAANGEVSGISLLMAQSLMFGTLVLQLKELLKGNELMPMTGEHAGKTYVKAMVQAGSMGLLGDIILKDPNQYQRSIASDLAGPLFGVTGDLIKSATSTVQEAYLLGTGEIDQMDWDGVGRTVRTLTPGASLWYTRLAFERLIIDTIDSMTDPNYYEKISNARAKSINERGDLGWWAPGDKLPEFAQ